MPDDVWMLGLALGLAVDAGLLLGLVLSGAAVRLPADLPRLATIGAAVAALGWTGLPVLVGLVRGGWAAVWAWKMRPWAQVAADAALDRHAAPPHATREEPPGAREDDERGWYIPVEITLLAGQVSGFTDTGLSEIMGSDARPVMQRFLADRGVLTQRPGAAGYGWADGVTLADALRRLRMGDLLPFPAGPAPEVRAPVQPTTRRDAPRRAAKGVIVEGVVIK